MIPHSPGTPAASLAGSHYVTRETARKAVDLVAPLVEASLPQRHVIGSGVLYLVVMDPGLPPGRADFDAAILYEHGFGHAREHWDADYAGFARAKAQASWATGLDGHRLQSLAPHLLRTGDSLLWGGVCLDGIVVAASGAHPWYDEVFAGAVALALRALAKEAREADRSRLFLEAPPPEPALLKG